MRKPEFENMVDEYLYDRYGYIKETDAPITTTDGVETSDVVKPPKKKKKKKLDK